jgi:hypothetical protein
VKAHPTMRVAVVSDVHTEIQAAGHPDADRLSLMRRTGTFIPPRPQ